jgi:hypothetical protein
VTPSERIREALGLLYSVTGRDGVDEERLGNARMLMSTVLAALGCETAKTWADAACSEGLAAAVQRLKLTIWEACSQQSSDKPDPALQALLRDSEVVFAAALKSQAVEAVPDLVEVLPPDGTRDAVVTSARELLGQVRIPLGYRVVMVATDESGAFVGVHSNVDPGDTHAILVCALRGEDRQDYPA